MPGSRLNFDQAAVAYLARCVESTGCLINPNLRPDGYGVLHYRDDELRRMSAHRAIFAFYHGAIPAGMVIRHACDNPPCVAREHLVLGTQADNIRDIYDRCRRTFENSVRGERHHSAVLTADVVAELRHGAANGISIYRMAKDRGLPYLAAVRAVRGDTWAWLEDPRPVAS